MGELRFHPSMVTNLELDLVQSPFHFATLHCIALHSTGDIVVTTKILPLVKLARQAAGAPGTGRDWLAGTGRQHGRGMMAIQS